MKLYLQLIFVLLSSIFLTGCSSSDRTNISKPFFLGEIEVLICKRPYTSSENCFISNAFSNGDEITKIMFSNGGYIDMKDTECSITAVGEHPVCLVWDQQDNTWDIFEKNINVDSL